jgi:hypothetical protein
MLYCRTCLAVHCLDEAPDEGVCLVCGGGLVENQAESWVDPNRTLTQAIVEAVNDGLTAAHLIRGKASRGEN